MVNISKSTTIQASVDRDEILYQNERTLVFRRHFAGGRGSIICKRPLGPKAGVRLQHERRILERLAGISGMQQLASTATPPTGVLPLEDRQLVSLAEAIRDKPLALPAGLPTLITLAIQLADIIAALHRAGVVHKDLSIANIMLCGTERTPQLIDFDLATTFAEERPGFIQPQDIAGTLAYMSPEQTGRTGRPVDHRTDLYALGSVLYELTIGHPPFADNYSDPLHLIHDILARVPKAPADLNRQVPQALSDILLRLLEKEPDRRYQSAEGLKADLLQLRERLARNESVTFLLGQHDYPLRLLPPSQLIGRDAEIGSLQKAFDAALQGRGKGVLVTGAPGVGKSVLINELRPIVTARAGWFVAGKFDQYRQDIATDAVGQALRALMALILAEPEREMKLLSERIQQALGSNVGLIAAMLPNVAVSLGIATEVAGGDPIQTAKRMIQGGLDMLRTVASRQRPIVMVIDDLQWATASALDFIDAVLTDDSLQGVLLIGSYRDGEVDATHPLTAMLSRWHRLNVAPLRLHLNNLPPDDLATLLAAMLHLPLEQATELGQAVGLRTSGNPFDTVELVNALRHDGALTLGEAGWQWDTETIRRYVGKSDVIDLLAARIARLSVAGRLLLESMACLGNEASPELLARATGLSDTELEAQLESALYDGLLVMEGNGNTLRFRHDRVQQAAYSSLDPELRTVLHLAIARRLARHEDFRVMAAEQYLSVVEAIEHADERDRVIDLFHEAATQARNVSSYVAAERLLAAALTLLKTTRDDSRIIALEIAHHTALYSLGRLGEADQVYKAIVGHCEVPILLMDALCIQMANLTNRARPREAMELGLNGLRQLGLSVPQDMEMAIAERIAAVLAWVSTLDQTEHLTRPDVSDLRALAIARLLHETQPAALACNPAMYAWLGLESQHQWVEYGPCPQLITSLCAITAHVIAMCKDYRAAYAIARYVLAVIERRHYETMKPMAGFVLATFTDHWFEPLEENINRAQLAREALLQQGNLLYACFTYYGELPALLDCMPSLDVCAVEFESALVFAARTGNDHAGAAFLPYRQFLRTLRGETAVAGSFNTDDFNEAEHVSALEANPTAGAYYEINRAISAMMFSDTPGLFQHSSAAIPLLVNTPGFYITALAHLMQSLSLAEQIKVATAEERAGLLAEFDICRDWLAARAVDAPMNFLHLLKWLDAERAWATGDFLLAVPAFDTALGAVASRQRPWHHALMTERAGLCHLTHGLEHTGRMLLAEASDLFEAWGASAKVAEMSRRHDFLRGAPALTQPGHGSHNSHNSATSSISTTSLDLLGILRASQTLSSETSLDRLSISVENLLREMTGATHIVGAMFFEDIQQWRITPKGESHTITVEAGSERGCLPLSVFNYVLRTREALIVNDVLRDDRFARDPYFTNVKSGSLLGVPIYSQSKLRLILIMENRLSHGAFVSDRLDAVMLVAGQLVISVDNALLYDSLERKVAERTQALEEANQRLASLSSTDALTGLANRRRFNEVFEAEWQRAIRPQTSLGVAMIDIDHFKLYNDLYGHQGGDECLRRVATTLKASVRGDADLVARYGGEEFVLVLPGSDLEATYVVAERARAAVAALLEPHAKTAGGIVTISVGITSAVPTSESDAEHLLELADAALYRAKKNGRNQVAGRREN